MTDTTPPAEQPAEQPAESETAEQQPEASSDAEAQAPPPQRYDAPNQQLVRPDHSGPGREPATFDVGAEVDGSDVVLEVPEDVKALSVEVDWGDGTPRDYWGTTTEQPTHTYASPGTYRIRVDPFGDDHTEAFVDITIEEDSMSTDPTTPEQPEPEPTEPDQPDQPDQPTPDQPDVQVNVDNGGTEQPH